MSAPDPDFLDILGKFTEYVQNERVRSYNEGVDAERERCLKIAETMNWPHEIAAQIANVE